MRECVRECVTNATQNLQHIVCDIASKATCTTREVHFFNVSRLIEFAMKYNKAGMGQPGNGDDAQFLRNLKYSHLPNRSSSTGV